MWSLGAFEQRGEVPLSVSYTHLKGIAALTIDFDNSSLANFTWGHLLETNLLEVQDDVCLLYTSLNCMNKYTTVIACQYMILHRTVYSFSGVIV